MRPFILLFLWGSLCQAAPSTYRFYKEINTTTLGEEEIVTAIFDSDLFSATANNYADIRILNDHSEVPYFLEKVRQPETHKVRQNSAGKVISLHEKEDNRIEIIVQPFEKPAEGIYFVTPLKDFERRVSIFGRDRGNWIVLKRDELIFDYTRYFDINLREIALPENRYYQFKVVIDEVTDEQASSLMELTRTFSQGEERQRIEKTQIEHRPFRMDSIGFWKTVEQKQTKRDKKANYPVVDFQVEQKQQLTLITINSQREPLTSFILSSSSRHFSRHVIVQVPQQDKWVTVGEATLSKLHFRNFHSENMKITFSEQRHTTYRLVIDNEDNPLIEITGIKAEGNVYQLVFLASKGAYRVYYGADQAHQPDYDVVKVIKTVREQYQPVRGNLGLQQANINYQPDFVGKNWLNSQFFLGIVIGLMVLVLGWGLFHASRRIE